MIAHQVRICQDDGTTQTVWVDASLHLRVGHRVTGKDTAIWGVVAIYPHAIMETADLPHGWHVGGLM